ncbi:unnamed protein product [Didymodactylos carnosus]|uniref:Uncharacterized protein n=1 Tax=Didymodactylos carnosus TaxID=1234261 RepID=A0A815FSX0_9BILA|nr:unnamed protein product [Didymodactylos carnosus]CAF1481135.1 unnamed protein product [Didymodactylos carnosus]CAF4183535.1 unnamed protein product [Didymodactylos carnosus]CAF4271659.1 unnamed protein product [Didymodactylos carnosus]
MRKLLIVKKVNKNFMSSVVYLDMDTRNIAEISLEAVDENMPSVENWQPPPRPISKYSKYLFIFAGVPVDGSSFVFILLGILLIIQISIFAIGIQYQDQCSIEPKIPIYLIVCGSVNAIGVGLAVILNIIALCSKQIMGNLVTRLIASVVCLLNFFSLIWIIVGCVWTFSVQSTVQHDDAKLNTYCNRTLYDFLFWIPILNCLLLLCTIIYFLWKK